VQFWNNEDNARGTGKVKVPLGRREVMWEPTYWMTLRMIARIIKTDIEEDNTNQGLDNIR